MGGGCWGGSLVHTCKYQENEVRSKCILNILNFWSWVIKNKENEIKKLIYIYIDETLWLFEWLCKFCSIWNNDAKFIVIVF